MNNLEKKVLIIAYHFPPELAVGSIRPKKKAMYLGQFGWKPYVLTIKEKHITQVDESLRQQVSDVPVFRTDVWKTPLQMALDVRSALRGNKPPGSNIQGSASAGFGRKNRVSETGMLSKIKQTLVFLNWIPDNRIGWFFPAVWQGRQIIRKYNISHILTTSPPFTCSIIGMVLARITGARLVVDFRDPWTHLPDRKPAEVISPVSEKIENWLESRVITRADAVITTTRKYRDALRLKYCHLPEGKFNVIYNGFDQSDFRRIWAVQAEPDVFTLSYVGTFYRDRDPQYLLRAVSELVREGVFNKQNIRVNFVGHVHRAMGRSVADMISAHGLSDMVSVNGVVPYVRALELMAASSALVLMAPNYYYQIPAKTFEYLALKKPILALMDEGAAADLIRRLEAGLMVRQDDVSGIKHALVDLYNVHKTGSNKYRQYDPFEFERSVQTGQLAEILDRL